MEEHNSSSLVQWKKILGDTPPRLDVDFVKAGTEGNTGAVNNNAIVMDPDTTGTSDNPSFIMHCSTTTHLPLDKDIVHKMQEICQERKVSLFSFALYVLHHTLQGYSRDAFAVGIAHDVRSNLFHDTFGMFMNTVLFPFTGGIAGGNEDVEDVHCH